MNTSNSQRFRQEPHFKDGKLYLFTNKSVMVVKGWPELRAWRKTAAGLQWKPVRPEMNIRENWVKAGGTHRRESLHMEMPDPMPELDVEANFLENPHVEPFRLEPTLAEVARRERCEKAETEAFYALLSFFDGFPGHVLGHVGQFTCCQWHLAVLLLRCPAALDLVRANPALAFCVASNCAFRSPRPTQPIRDARRWIQRRQREIAGWLGFPATEQTVSILRKIPPEACRIETLRHLRQALGESEIAATLRHFPRLTATVLHIVTDPRLRALTSPRLLRELSGSVVEWGIVSRHVRILQDTLEMAATLVPPRQLPVFDSLAQLTRHHDELADEMNLKQPPLLEHLVFPPPPIPGHDTIVPLTVPAMLAEEGCEQQNCVVTYAKRVARGNEFIYRVLAPERATLQILRTQQGWQIGELSGPRNRSVSRATRIAVEQWIAGDGWDKDWAPF